MTYRGGFVADDRERGRFTVRRELMTSPAVWADERLRIFNRCWLYVGHESEVPVPGAVVSRSVGGRPLLLARDEDGVVLVRVDPCPGLPKPEPSTLPAPPGQAAHYRGLYFVNYAANPIALEDYLGAAIEYLDLVLDQAVDGMRVVPGSHRYEVRANWKLMVENSVDGYHANSVHATYFDFVASSGGGQQAGALDHGTALDLGHGHAVTESGAAWARPIAFWEPIFGDDARPEIEAIKADLVRRHGAHRAERMGNTFRNLLIFPNLIVNDVCAVTIRRIEPLAPARHRVEAWAVAPAEERAGSNRLQRRLDSFLTFLGPGGFASPDDVEALESCQAGYAATDVYWNDLSRGMGRPPGRKDELQMRTFWRMYATLMDDGDCSKAMTDIVIE